MEFWGNGAQVLFVRGVTGKFFWGGRVIFPDFFPGVKCFFPVENSILVDPKQILVVLKSDKVLSSFCNFPPSLLQFSFFSSQFAPLFPFFFTSFLPVGQQKFPCQKSLGALCPPTCYATAICFKKMMRYIHSQEISWIPHQFVLKMAKKKE